MTLEMLSDAMTPRPTDSTRPSPRRDSSRRRSRRGPSEALPGASDSTIAVRPGAESAELEALSERRTTPPPPPPAGSRLPVIAERFRMLNIVGYGSYGLVFRGREVRSGEPVAIKILKSDCAGDPLIEGQWRREQELAATLRISGAPRGIAAGDDLLHGSRVSYLVTELIAGQNLKDWRGGLAEVERAEVYNIARGMAEALGQLRSLAIIHRDIKPGNVMRTESGKIKVMDFGLHRRLDQPAPESPEKLVGTPQYMAPEHIAGDSGSFAGDIYAFACTLFFVITGDAPFTGPGVADVLRSHRRDPFPPLPEPWQDSPFEDLLREMSAKDPGDRPTIRTIQRRLADPDDPLQTA